MKYIESTMIWKGINIKVRYNSNYFKSTHKTGNYRLAHLEVIAENKTSLPFTESGYRSHFCSPSEIEEYDTPIDFVKEWLETTSKSKQWNTHKKLSNQLTLF